VIGTVLNNGLFKAWNAVNDFLGLSWHINPLGTIPGFSEGGFTGPGIFGTGDKYDPAGIVHANEFVVNQEQTAKNLPLLQAINEGRGGYANGGLVLPGYAGGGLVGAFGTVWNSVTDILGSLTSSLTGPISDFFSKFGHSNMASILGGIPASLLDKMWSKLSGAIGNAFNNMVQAAAAAAAAVVGTTSGNNFAVVPSSRSGNVAAVQAAAANYGWNAGAEWNALVNVIMRESGFNNVAQNPTSTAFGMFQFLDSTWAGYGPKTSNAAIQAIYGMEYIKSRYGDPIGAQAHENQFGWYDNGGWLPPGITNVYNGTGQRELILNPGQQANLHQMLIGNQSGGGATQPVWQFFIGDREITDLVDARVTHWSNTDARNIRSQM
jgi:hypothetical protein